MTWIFWFGTLCLCLIAFCFVLPWIKSSLVACLISVTVLISSYGLYLHQGSSQFLKEFYSAADQTLRVKQTEFRILLAEFKKEEFRLRVRLEENPHDTESQWRLFDLLAIKALYNQDPKLAILYWEKAIKIMPEMLKGEFKAKLEMAMSLNKTAVAEK